MNPRVPVVAKHNWKTAAAFSSNFVFKRKNPGQESRAITIEERRAFMYEDEVCKRPSSHLVVKKKVEELNYEQNKRIKSSEQKFQEANLKRATEAMEQWVTEDMKMKALVSSKQKGNQTKELRKALDMGAVDETGDLKGGRQRARK